MIKTYKVKGTYWRQGELMYPEALEVFALTRGRLKGAFGGIGEMGAKIDELSSDGTLAKIFAIVMKPHEPTFVHRKINRTRCARLGIKAENVINHMTAPQVAQAALDFFFINASWTRKFLNTRIGSISWFQRGPTVWQAVLSTLKVSSNLPGATISRRDDSAPSAPPT